MGLVRTFFGEQMIILPRQARDEREATQKEVHLLMQGTGQTTERITTVMHTTNTITRLRSMRRNTILSAARERSCWRPKRCAKNALLFSGPLFPDDIRRFAKTGSGQASAKLNSILLLFCRWKALDDQQIPIKYIQLDDWWYLLRGIYIRNG